MQNGELTTVQYIPLTNVLLLGGFSVFDELNRGCIVPISHPLANNSEPPLSSCFNKRTTILGSVCRVNIHHSTICSKRED